MCHTHAGPWQLRYVETVAAPGGGDVVVAWTDAAARTWTLRLAPDAPPRGTFAPPDGGARAWSVAVGPRLMTRASMRALGSGHRFVFEQMVERLGDVLEALGRPRVDVSCG